MYLLSFFVFMVLCLVLMVLSAGGSLGAIIAFIDMPSVLLIILTLVPMLWHAGIIKDLNNAFRIGGKRRIQAQKVELIRAVEAVSYTIKALWTVGIFNAVFGFIIATTRADVGADMMFAYAGVSLIPLSYTTFLVILLLPLKTRLNMQLKVLCEESGNVGAHEGQKVEQEQEDCSNKRTQ